MKKGAVAYLLASLVSQAAALARYIVLARILGPEQLGLAAMLILITQFFDSISDTGSDRFLIQDAEGDSEVMQRFVQMVMLGRGILIAISLVVFCQPLATVLGAKTIAASVAAIAIVPIFTAFLSVDIRRAQRHNDYLPESVTVMAGETMGLVGTAIGAFVVRDHTAVIYGLAARALTMAVVSNIMSKRPYRVAFARAQAQRFSGFAAPLILNGILLFVGSQGDRLLVGSRLGAAALGHYSAVLLLIFYPTSALMTFIMGMHLPPLSAARDDPRRWSEQRSLIGGRSLLIATFMLAGFALVGPLVTPLFYGHRFAQAPSLFAILGCFQAMRFLRTWPTTMAVSLGRSTIVMWGNVARMIALPAAFLGNMVHPGPEAIAGGFFLGETLALTTALTLLARADAVSLPQELRRMAVYLVTAVLVFGAALSVEQRAYSPAALLAAGVVVWLGAIAWRERNVVLGMLEMVRRRTAGSVATERP